MKLLSFTANGRDSYGAVVGDGVVWSVFGHTLSENEAKQQTAAHD